MSSTGANIRGVCLAAMVVRSDLLLRSLQSNILISDGHPPRALLGDIGLNAIIPDPLSLTRSSVIWTAPELLTPDNTPYRPSVAGDVYAFAMVIYEVSVGSPPILTCSDVIRCSPARLRLWEGGWQSWLVGSSSKTSGRPDQFVRRNWGLVKKSGEVCRGVGKSNPLHDRQSMLFPPAWSKQRRLEW